MKKANTYYLRDKSGLLKAEFPRSRANEIFDNVPGFFRAARYPSGNKTVFEITEDSSMGLSSGGEKHATIFLMTGDYLVPNT